MRSSSGPCANLNLLQCCNIHAQQAYELPILTVYRSNSLAPYMNNRVPYQQIRRATLYASVHQPEKICDGKDPQLQHRIMGKEGPVCPHKEWRVRHYRGVFADNFSS